ncbi:hypothetical protein OIU84_020003 [Salix udensis]|uniref:Uncharacterized protein n=1 Tax=Salix udensis TaxID=889485 RepID=A0AAD6L069_9ROSI|nr:hypothetical protein OIU84_020003 [Salix udensis]
MYPPFTTSYADVPSKFAATFCLDNAMILGASLFSIATLYAPAVSFPSAGLKIRSRGTALSPASCSTGWKGFGGKERNARFGEKGRENHGERQRWWCLLVVVQSEAILAGEAELR